MAASVAALLALLLVACAAPAAGLSHDRPRRRRATKEVSFECGVGRLPANGRVAVLLRGQGFREGVRGGGSCNKSSRSFSFQHQATSSLINRVVRPLLKEGNEVDVFSTHQDCPLMAEVSRALQRVPGLNLFDTVLEDQHNQAENLDAAVRYFVHSVGSVQRVMSTYDLVIVTRHDIHWYQRISRWPTADFCQFNFGSNCEPDARMRPSCVNDIIHTMPGSLFQAAMHPLVDCFLHEKNWGHTCRNEVEHAVGKERVGLCTDWVPKRSVRERAKNPWARPYGTTA